MPDFNAIVRAHLPALHVSAVREAEIVAELAQQLEQTYQDAVAGGATESDAMARARTHLGDWERLAKRIEGEDERRGASMTGSAGDLRYALRFLWRNPVFTAVAIATLAFGIGGNTAVFTLVDTLLLHGLPYHAPERLMAIETRKSLQAEVDPWSSAPDFFDLRARTRSYSALAGISPVWNVVLTGRGPAEQLDALFVSSSFFPMLGVEAALGRTFSAQEDPQSPLTGVVVVSHRFWQRRLGGSRDAIDQILQLDNSTYKVIGVLPANFRWAGEPLIGRADTVDAWFPLAANPLVNTPRSLRFLKIVGRLQAGATPQQANEETRQFGVTQAEQYAATNRGFDWSARPLEDLVTGRIRASTLLLAGAVAFVLLMACANVANLLLARGAARQKEIAVRVALGASRARLLRQLVIEGLLLATLGGCAGIPLAIGALRFFTVTGPVTFLQGMHLRLDGRALAVTAGAVVLCAILSGLPPAIRLTGPETGNALREAGRGLIAGHRRLRAVLVAGQIAAALVLLVGAGLLIRGFQHLLEVRPGIDPHNLVTIATQLPATARTPPQRAALWQRMQTTIESTPGVVGAAAVSRLPFSGTNLGTWVFVEGHYTPGEPGREVEYRVCTPNYFAVMGIPLLAGRVFDSHDDLNPGSVVVINQTMARQLWPGTDAVGKRMKNGLNAENAPWVTVIGVVGDVRHFGLEAAPRPEMYRTYAVNPLGSPVLVVRTRVDPAPLLSELGGRIRALDPNLPVYRDTLMERLVELSTAQRRFVMLLLAGFALAALLVAGVGVYGMLAQAVAHRTAEIGLRMAMGATPGAVQRLIFREGAQLMMAGIGAGSVLAAVLAWMMRGMLFVVGPFDPVAFLSAAAALSAFALAACYIPARRATRVDPIAALRQ